MLHEFLSRHRGDLIERCRGKVSQRPLPEAGQAGLVHGIPLFIDQLIKTLQVEQTSEPMQSRKVSGPAGGNSSIPSELGATAALHGSELMRQGFTVDQVVHAYGDLCQSITDLAFERHETIAIDEFRTLNRCLDNAIAGAVTEYAYQHDAVVTNLGVQALNERLGCLAHELRNLVHTGTLAVAAMRSGNVGISGATGAVLDRCLIGLRTLIDRSLSEVRANAGLAPQPQIISLAEFIKQIASSASMEATARECKFTVAAVDERLAVTVDREMLFSAVGNLLQNAFKFTRHGTEVSLSAFAFAERILIEVEDHCGGLPPGAAKTIFQPFVQCSADRSGVGLGLAISQRCVDANDGVLRVRDVPGSGCVYTIDLPRHSLP